MSSIAERHRFLFVKLTDNDEHLIQLIDILEQHFPDAFEFFQQNMGGARAFAAPSYSSRENAQNSNTGGSGMATPSRTNSNIVLFTDPVENIRNFVVKKAQRYCSGDVWQTYPMKKKNRGYLFFVNISEFPDKSKFREGAQVDKANIITLHRQIEYNKIQYHENISLEVSLLNDEISKMT